MYRALVVIPAEGGPERILSESLDVRVQATGGILWTPDSRAVTVVTPRGIVTVDLSGRVLRDLPVRLGYLEQATGYSPDGRWLAMHRRPEGSQMESEQDVWLLPAEGGRAIQVTHDAGFDGWPTWAADGRSLYFISARGGSHNVWQVEVDPQSGLAKGPARQLTSYTDALILHPRPIKSGRSIAFTLLRETTAVYAGATDAPAAGRVVARGERPQIAPDGRTVFFLGQGPDEGGILAVPAEGGTPRRVTSTQPGGPAFDAFAIAPGGDRLAYFSKAGAHNVLFTVPAAGGPPRELVRFESSENLVPSWSPDGKLLAYSHGNGLYAIPAAGGEASKLSHLYAWDGWTVRWSPDGEHVAALGWTAPNQQNAVFVVPARGGEARRLTPESEVGYKEGLEWHPDAKRLSYMYYGIRNRNDGTQLAYLDGRPTSVLVNLPNPQWDYVGLWHPAGREFYFISSRTRAWDLYGVDERGNARLVLSRGDAEPGFTPPHFSADGRAMTWALGRTTRQVWTVELAR
jgi:Tol biopolymer transport system component